MQSDACLLFICPCHVQFMAADSGHWWGEELGLRRLRTAEAPAAAAAGAGNSWRWLTVLWGVDRSSDGFECVLRGGRGLQTRHWPARGAGGAAVGTRAGWIAMPITNQSLRKLQQGRLAVLHGVPTRHLSGQQRRSPPCLVTLCRSLTVLSNARTLQLTQAATLRGPALCSTSQTPAALHITMESELLRLRDLLTAPAPASAVPGPATPGFGTARRPARPSSAAAAAAAQPGLPSAAATHELGVQLHSSLAKELSTLDALFAHWQAGKQNAQGCRLLVGCGGV